MKQFLGLINNQIMFHYTDIKGDTVINKSNLDNTITTTKKTDNNLIYQGQINKIQHRNYFNTKQHLITGNINYLFMYYQMDNNSVQDYDKTFNVGIGKLDKIFREIN